MVISCGKMKSACVAVLVVVLGSVAASDSHDHKRLVETLLRHGAEHVGPKLLPALKQSRIEGIGAVSNDAVVVSKYTFSVQSTTQNVEGELANLTVSGLSSIKVGNNGNSFLAGVNITIEGQYSLYGTSNGVLLEGKGGISIQETDLEAEVSTDYTAIDENKIAINSVDIKLSAPSVKVVYENLIIDMGAAKFLKDLLEH